ncbi:MAG: YfiT family bacillithiol transferase, partial [Bacteroidota bacterium]
MMTDPRYPVGEHKRKESITENERLQLIQQIAEAPEQLRSAVRGLTEAQLDTPYREGGWTVRQVVHHLPDSHLNAYVRFKLALTEEHPTIKPYEQQLWAELHDAKSGPVEPSLTLLDSLHKRWVSLLQSMLPSDFARTLNHPE